MKITKKIFQIILLAMAHLLATICPPFVKNAAWCPRQKTHTYSVPKTINNNYLLNLSQANQLGNVVIYIVFIFVNGP